MKQILGLICSPRRLGNSELIVKEISRHISVEHQLNLLRLSDFHLEPCRGCYACLTTGHCRQHDDLTAVLEPIVEADGLIIAVPTYFLGPNSVLKRLLDRGLSFYSHADRLWGKPAVGVAVAGIPGKEGYTLLGLENFLQVILADIKKTEVMYGALPGEVLLDEENKATAAEIARSLLAPTDETKGPCCPVCGSRTFRFLEPHRVRCMLCSNEGTINWKSGEIHLDIRSGGHEVFLDKEAALSHRDWLLGMRDRYKQDRDRLKRLSAPYRDDGRWIRPSRNSSLGENKP